MRRLIAAILTFAALFAGPVAAAQLTDAQAQTLVAALRADADPAVAAALAARNDTEVARIYNLPTAFIVWKTSVTPNEWDTAMMQGATQMDALTVGKRDTLFVVMSRNRDCRDPNVVTTINDLTGTQNMLKAALVAACKRVASKAETLFTTGTGTTAAPGSLIWEGPLTVNDVSNALNRF